MSPYWSHDACGWVQVAPPDLLDTPWAGHGLPLPHLTEPLSPAQLILLPDVAMPEQRAAASVDA